MLCSIVWHQWCIIVLRFHGYYGFDAYVPGAGSTTYGIVTSVLHSIRGNTAGLAGLVRDRGAGAISGMYIGVSSSQPLYTTANAAFIKPVNTISQASLSVNTTLRAKYLYTGVAYYSTTWMSIISQSMTYYEDSPQYYKVSSAAIQCQNTLITHPSPC